MIDAVELLSILPLVENFLPSLLLTLFHFIDGFHSDVIKWLSQNREVLRILIYTRLKINKK